MDRVLGWVVALLVLFPSVLLADDYSDAYKKAEAGEAVMLVVVSEDWCPHCVALKRDLQRAGVSFVELKSGDRRARKMMTGDSIPQIHCFFKHQGQGWCKESVVGRVPVPVVRRVIQMCMEEQ